MAESVNYLYWLKMAKDHTDKTIQSRDDAATALDNYLSVVWTVYTSVFALGTIFDKLPVGNVGVLIFLFLPVFLVATARYLCVWVKLPIKTEFRPDMPDDIRDRLYNVTVDEKTNRMRIAGIATIIAGMSVGAAVAAYGHYKATAVTYSVNAFKLNVDNDVYIVGTAEASKTVQVSVIYKSKPGADIVTQSVSKEITTNAIGSFKLVVLHTKATADLPVSIYVSRPGANEEKVISTSKVAPM